ncbi:MAG: alpha/beta fold hydrolase [Elusimicrobia bacterium]|nr:alpha/beta fold hydrolase [Elusimicrobiota bacterium]
MPGAAEQFRVRVGRTPSRLVRRDGAASLRFYPARGRTRKPPVFLVYAMVNRPFILDLLPGLSVVERLTAAGRPVYLLDWGEPREEDAGRGLDDYILGVLDRSIEAARRRSKVGSLHLAGYCEGGVFSLLYTALRPEKVRTLALLATPVDYKRMGTLSVWARRANFDAGRLARSYGNIPGSFLHAAFEVLKPFTSLRAEGEFLSKMLDGALSKEQQEHFLALERWKKEHVAHPGKAFAEVVRGLFQENRLLKNAFKVGGKAADLRRVKCPLFVAVGEKDHLVPPAAALPVTRLAASRDARVERVPVGHIGLSVSGRAHKELWPRYLDWIAERD